MGRQIECKREREIERERERKRERIVHLIVFLHQHHSWTGLGSYQETRSHSHHDDTLQQLRQT